jgi:hypothetical protein
MTSNSRQVVRFFGEDIAATGPGSGCDDARVHVMLPPEALPDASR